MTATAKAPAQRGSARVRILAVVAVAGPGLLAGLSDDDPAGITTYSVLGASFGYQLLWVLLLSTIALIVFHGLGARMGVVTGQGLTGLIRQRFGVRSGLAATALLVVANTGTTCAEFAGVAVGMELFGVSRLVSVPIAATTVSLLVLRGSFHRVEHVLLVLSSVFIAYVVSGIASKPDWAAAGRGLVVPSSPLTREALVIATATIGTTLAPWGLSFIQSYAADKKLTVNDLKSERIDVVTGAVLTGVIGFFVVVACAATLHDQGIRVHDAADAARALEPLAGSLASTLFAVGLVGAALLAASILPLSTAYSVSEFVGSESSVDDHYGDARLFYVSFVAIVVAGAAVVLIPGVPLISLLVATQVLNAVLLLPLLGFMYIVAGDADLMGEHVSSPRARAGYLVAIALIALCVGALLVLTVT